jgi:hypothetical protein
MSRRQEGLRPLPILTPIFSENILGRLAGFSRHSLEPAQYSMNGAGCPAVSPQAQAIFHPPTQ